MVNELMKTEIDVVQLSEITMESHKIRELLNSCDKSSTPCVIDSFPVMSCKLSSFILAYHLLQRWPYLRIKGICGGAGIEDRITHYWLEVQDMAIDITGDQYNILRKRDLTKKIQSFRPFPQVHTEEVTRSYLYRVFRVLEVDTFIFGFPDYDDDFMHEVKSGYEVLNASKTN